MLKKGIKLIQILVILTIVSYIIFSEDEPVINKHIYDDYIKENYDQYSQIREDMIDTLNQWKADSLVSISPIFYGNDWHVDSILIFNRDSTRCFTTLNKNYSLPFSPSDFIEEFTGAWIDGRWYFYFGSNRVLPRRGYKSDDRTPFTAEEIGYISHSRIMSDFLKVNTVGYHIHYRAMDDYFYRSYKSYYPNINKIDSLILVRQVENRKSKLSIKEIESVKESELRKSKLPIPERTVEKKSLWDKIFNSESTKIFDSEAWKNRNKKN